jgi:hypothetical protein
MIRQRSSRSESRRGENSLDVHSDCWHEAVGVLLHLSAVRAKSAAQLKDKLEEASNATGAQCPRATLYHNGNLPILGGTNSEHGWLSLVTLLVGATALI